MIQCILFGLGVLVCFSVLIAAIILSVNAVCSFAYYVAKSCTTNEQLGFAIYFAIAMGILFSPLWIGISVYCYKNCKPGTPCVRQMFATPEKKGAAQ